MNRESHLGLGRRITALLVVLFFCLTIAACDTGNVAEDTGKEKKETGRKVPAPYRRGVRDEQATRAGGKGWEATLTTDRQLYEIGEPVRMTLRFTNRSKQALQLTFPSSKMHDFTAADEDGRIVWRWSHGRAFAQALQERTVLAGGSLKREVAWDGSDNKGNRVDPGDYKVKGWFTAFDYDQKVGPLSFEVR